MSTQKYAGIAITKRNFVIGIHGKNQTQTNNIKGFEHTIYLRHCYSNSL